jgi:hypothetical protein
MKGDDFMSDLAFNINGEAFEVPANAAAWRVRRMRNKGAPEVVYGRDGLPLVVPISAQMEELRAEIDTTGRYRLDLIDADSKTITGAPSGYVQVNVETAPASSEVSAGVLPLVSRASLGGPNDNIVLESMRLQSLVAIAAVERFPQMMEAAATLLRAADGAGLPMRPPMAVVDPSDGTDDDDDDDSETDGRINSKLSMLVDLFQPMVGPAVDRLVKGLVNGQVGLPSSLGEMFDWRKAAEAGKKAKAEQAPAGTPAAQPATEAPTTAPTSSEPPKLNLQDAAHFMAIQSALAPAEAAFARQAASNLSRDELAAWMQKLGQLNVADAVAEIRKEIAKATAAEGAQ